jgi:hypothetical protein
MPEANPVPPTIGAEYFNPRAYKKIQPAALLDYTLTKLESMLGLFDMWAEKPGIKELVERECRSDISTMIRRQYVLGWDKSANVSTPYREIGLNPGDPLDLDHVVPVSTMARLVLAQKTMESRQRMFVRAWLAPVALISKESHDNIVNEAATSDLITKNPFTRYKADNIQISLCGEPLPEDFTIQHHYDLLATNPAIGQILRGHKIVA